MATVNESQIVTTNSEYNLTKGVMKAEEEILNMRGKLALLKRHGVLNYHADLTRASGTALTIYNSPRMNAKGLTGDFDRYSQAIRLDSGSRSLNIRLFGQSVVYSLKGSEKQQIAEFDLKARVPRLMAQWMKEVLLTQIILHACGHTGTSVDAPTVSDTPFTTAEDLLRIRGNNATTAPTSIYKAIGNEGAGNVTTDQGVTSANTLRLVDFMNARETINSVTGGVPIWQRLDTSVGGKLIDAIVLVGTSGMNQLKNDAVASGQGINFAQLQYASLAGGHDFGVGDGLYYMENMLFCEMPDYLMARGIHSGTSAEVANTRRAVMLGLDAIDMGAGKGYSYKGDDIVAGFSMKLDENYKSMNDEGYASIEFNGGVKKNQKTGTGANASTLYDNSCFVITHYTAS